jgi:WYL domain
MAEKRTPKTAIKKKAEEPQAIKPKKSTMKAEVSKAKKETAKKSKAPEVEILAIPVPETKIPKKAPKKSEPMDEGQAFPPLAQELLRAIQEGRAVEFLFKDANANAPRTFEPRQLSFDALSQAWFVWGWDRRYNAERHHRVDLLAEVNAVEGVGRSAQGPYQERTPANQIGGWLGGDAIAVKVLLHKQWVFAVKQAPPAFPEFKVEDQEEGKATVTFTATDLRAIARWCLQFGDGITIQEPARLLDRVRQVATVWLGKAALQPLSKAAPVIAAPAPKPEAQPEAMRHRERKEHVEREAPKSSNPKVETRFERL